jgi:hypothetical protein
MKENGLVHAIKLVCRRVAVQYSGHHQVSYVHTAAEIIHTCAAQHIHSPVSVL